MARNRQKGSFVIIYRDVRWLPFPNQIELFLTDIEAPRELTRTAFLLPIHDDGSVTLAVNQRRGVEIPGGHVEDGETLIEAAIREAIEEAACEVEQAIPIGYFRMTSHGEVDEDWPYPHPVSYQQFYTGRVTSVLDFTPDDECDTPTRVTEMPEHKKELRFLMQAAHKALER